MTAAFYVNTETDRLRTEATLEVVDEGAVSLETLTAAAELGLDVAAFENGVLRDADAYEAAGGSDAGEYATPDELREARLDAFFGA